MAKEPDIGTVAEKLLISLDEATKIVDGLNEGLESKALKVVLKELKAAERSATKLVKLSERLLDELEQAADEDDDDEDDDEDDDWDDD